LSLAKARWSAPAPLSRRTSRPASP
jgi:hypothetical protein